MKPLVGIFIAAVATPALAQQDHGAAVQQAPATDAHHAPAGHEPGIPDPPGGPPSAAALGGPAHAADAIFGGATMAPARDGVAKDRKSDVSGKRWSVRETSGGGGQI